MNAFLNSQTVTILWFEEYFSAVMNCTSDESSNNKALPTEIIVFLNGRDMSREKDTVGCGCCLYVCICSAELPHGTL